MPKYKPTMFDTTESEEETSPNALVLAAQYKPSTVQDLLSLFSALTPEKKKEVLSATNGVEQDNAIMSLK